MNDSDFIRAIKLSITGCSDFSGRSSRAEFWFGILFQSILIVILFTIHPLLPKVGNNIVLISCLALLLTSFVAISVRRLHDINYSGFKLLWILLPVLGVFINLYWACCKGNQRSNKFGNPPLQLYLTLADKILIITFISLILIVLLLASSLMILSLL